MNFDVEYIHRGPEAIDLYTRERIDYLVLLPGYVNGTAILERSRPAWKHKFNRGALAYLDVESITFTFLHLFQ